MNEDGVGTCDACGEDITLPEALSEGDNYFCNDDCMTAYYEGNKMTKTICIYHAHCLDGFGAAYAVWKKFGDEIEYYPASYSEDPPDVTGMDVIMVDFSYKRPELEKMLERCRSMIVLDHHKTAEAELNFLQKSRGRDHPEGEYAAAALFDMSRSGAVITWHYFHPDEPIPKLLLHIQDRDLWLFDLPNTKEICAALFLKPMEFRYWDYLARRSVLTLVEEGTIIMLSTTKQITDFIAAAAMRTLFDDYDVPILNAPFMWASEAGHIMAEDEAFSITYYDHAKGRKYSLRSTGVGVDVAEIAVRFGGGGHRNAAGFDLTKHQLNHLQDAGSL